MALHQGVNENDGATFGIAPLLDGNAYTTTALDSVGSTRCGNSEGLHVGRLYCLYCLR